MAVEGDELLQRLRFCMTAAMTGVPPQRFQNARHLLAEANERFARGDMDLQQRAVRNAVYAIAHEVRGEPAPQVPAPPGPARRTQGDPRRPGVLQFSLFQSLPDIWAIDQIFPVMPLHRLDEAPDQAALVHDLTCDSDGCIDSYVDQDGVESTLMLHAHGRVSPTCSGVPGRRLPGDPRDMHNLFGDTDARST